MAQKFTDWLKTHKNEAYLGSAGTVVALALYVKSRKAASSSSSGTSESTEMPTSTADTTGTDAYNGIEDQVLGLQSALLGLAANGLGGSPTTGPNPGGPNIPATPDYQMDSVAQGTLGYYGDPSDSAIHDIGGSSEYTPFTDWAGAQSFLSSGGTLYTEDQPGVFDAASAGGNLTIPGGTGSAVYQKVGG